MSDLDEETEPVETKKTERRPTLFTSPVVRVNRIPTHSASTIYRLWRYIGHAFSRSHSRNFQYWHVELNEINYSCTAFYDDPRATYRSRKYAFKRLDRLVSKLSRSEIQSLDIKLVIWSILECVLHFLLYQRNSGRLERKRIILCESADNCYERILKKLLPEKGLAVVDGIFSFISDCQAWSLEYFCVGTFEKALVWGVQGEDVILKMLDHVDEIVNSNVMEARQVIRIMYELLRTQEWPFLENESLECFNRLLEMYRQSTHRAADAEFSPLCKGLEVCVRRICDHLRNSDLLVVIKLITQWVLEDDLTDESVLILGNVVEYAAMIHTTTLYEETITSEVFLSLLNMVASERRIISHLGNRVLQQLLDRKHNRHQFSSPKIYFQNTHFTIELGEYHSQDKNFLKRHRETMHDSLVKAFLVHGMHRINLDSAYVTICIIAAEVPCGFTAAALACLAMNIQETVLHTEDLDELFSFHLQACVMSIMTLLCWIHKAPEFYDYVNSVMKKRADQAPHLNPPLKTMYSFAQHHVLWNKPELFFEEWEVRYGLWKFFKIKDLRQAPKPG